MTYALCGVVVDSDLDLPELTVTSGPSTCTVRTGTIDTGVPSQPVHVWQSPHSTEVRLSITRRQDGYVLQFGDAARFLIAPCGESIVVEPDTSTPASTLRHLLLDQVLPLALSARGHVVLHAAAVRLGDRAVGFLGHTGAGKSTLAARTAQLTKGMVLSDDCLRIDVSNGGALAIPSYPGSRLWPDAIAAGDLCDTPSAPVADDSEKRRVVVGTGTAWRATTLEGLYLLEQDSTTEIAIEPCGGADAVLTLVEHAYRLDPTDRGRTADEFRRLAALASACAVKRLRYPRAFSQLPAIVSALLRDRS